MNSRGLLLAEETLKIVISLIALGFLVYFLSALYFNNVDGQKQIQAESSIGRLMDVVGNVGSNSELVSEITPAGWSLFAFNFSEKKPNLCGGQACICICDSITFNFADRQIKECDKNGACGEIPNLGYFNEIKISSPGISLLVEKQNGGIFFTKK